MNQPISALVVDDDPDHRHLMERRLREAGVQVRTVDRGERALEELDGVDLVLLDYNLPGLSGVETLQKIRAADGPSVVMVTGMGSQEVVIEAMRAGAVDYVVKDDGYLAALPSVVERAWRQHDLEQRSRELQRLALVVSSASERDTVLAEIVSGAHRLLRADACRLYLERAFGAQVGADESLLLEASEGLAQDDDVVVRLPIVGTDGGPNGVLEVRSRPPRTFAPEELELASAFSSFAEIALAKNAQLDVERRLVAELQNTLNLRRQLVSSISHELRTPLTCINGFAATLEVHWDRLTDADRIDLVRRVRSNGEDLKDLVERLLDFAYIEAGRLEVHAGILDLALEVQTAVETLAPILAGREVSLEVGHVLVKADADLVRRTLWNLLTNAVKYAAPDGSVTIRTVEDGDKVRVEVADSGEGMSPEDAARVFEPFWRSQHVRDRARGTGLGLALVKDYTRLMGGEVGVRSNAGEGSTFWFTLPAA